MSLFMEDLVQALIKIKSLKEPVGQIHENSPEFNFKAVKGLLDEGFISGKYRASDPGSWIDDVSIRPLGHNFLNEQSENKTPRWKLWDKGWKKWLGGVALVCGLVFTILKIMEVLS